MFQYYNGNFIPIESIFRTVLIFYAYFYSWLILLPGFLSASIGVLSFQTWLTVLQWMLRFFYFCCFFSLILRGADILSRFYQIYGSFSQYPEEITIFSEYDNGQGNWYHYCQIITPCKEEYYTGLSSYTALLSWGMSGLDGDSKKRSQLWTT